MKEMTQIEKYIFDLKYRSNYTKYKLIKYYHQNTKIFQRKRIIKPNYTLRCTLEIE